jgi:archaellum component FlaC
MEYVKLITEAYFEVNASTRYDFELKKELFQQILTRKHSVLEQKKHITEKEFLTQCGLALNKVRKHLIETLEFRENPRYDYLGGGINRKDNIFVEIEDIGGKADRELSEDELNELEKLFGFIAMLYHKAKQSQQPETEPEAPQQTEYTIRQIALKLAYEDVSVTKENAEEIIKRFGHSSGQKLYQEFNRVWNSKKRIADPDKSLKILQNKIKLFESVAEILSTELKPKAEDEIKILYSYVSKY